MEMVATAKSKKTSDRVNASKPYSEKLKELMGSLSDLSSNLNSPYLRKPDQIKKVGILVITANRGLCGGYNSNVLKMAKSRLAELKKSETQYDLYVVGKKGISFFKYQKETMKETYTNIDDTSGYREAEHFANLFLQSFALGEVDSVEIISTVYQSSSIQNSEIQKILPIEPKKTENLKKSAKGSTIYEPNPERILESLLPQVVRTAFLKAILEAVCSEQIARRIAMKSATDAANDMIKVLTRTYNRVRQAKITQEISEIVAGADSLN